ncbi:MAG: 2-hydroxychromene-2-carboxylate isomerase [Pseudomonadota bacterium]
MTLEIWFEFASTYSYLTVSRAEELLRAGNVRFSWKPFLLGPIFRDKGMETSPFVLDPVKGAHMWRDMERRSARYGLPFAQPAVWPMNPIRAARVMTAALDEPWCGAFARAVFCAQFVRGEDIADAAVLARALEDCGVDPAYWLDRSQSDEIKSALRERTEQARSFGIFGAPSFRVGDELFWGDDRLEDAIAWTRSPGLHEDPPEFRPRA